MRNCPRRFLALLIALVMVFGLFPTAAFAETSSEQELTDQISGFAARENADPEMEFEGTEAVEGSEASPMEAEQNGTRDARTAAKIARAEGEAGEQTAVSGNAGRGTAGLNGDTVNDQPGSGADYTVSFTAPAGVTAPAPMVINSAVGAELPTVTAPEGFTFRGWVLEEYDNVDMKPAQIWTGKYIPQSDVTLKALFSYREGFEEIGYELVTEDQGDWTGDYIITCNKVAGEMAVMHSVDADMSCEAQNANGMFEFSNTGMELENNVLRKAAENFVFHVEARDEGYSIQNLGSENFLGRYVTSNQGSALLWSYGEFDPTFCRWTFKVGEHGRTDATDNVIIESIRDSSLDQYYPFLGCGWYYHFTGDSDRYPFFWVDGTGSGYDSDVYFMYLWKADGTSTCYWTTVLPNLNPGTDYRVQFSVPAGCEKPEDMISNTNTGITLPTLTAPEGYTFLGWVEDSYENIDTCPDTILTGSYTADRDITLYALFSHPGEGSVTIYRRADTVVDGGKYVLVSDESINGSTGKAVGNSVVVDRHYLRAVEVSVNDDDTCAVAEPAQVLWETSGNAIQGFSFYNAASGQYIGLDSREHVYLSDTPLSWLYTADGYLDNMVDTEGYYYLSYDQSKDRYTTSKRGAVIRLYQETELIPTVYTTGIDVTDMVDLYIVDQDDNAAAYIHAVGVDTENAPFPGESVTALGVDEHGHKFYKITLDRAAYTEVVFSDGTAETQTAALSLGDEAYIVYYISGQTASQGTDIWPGPGEEEEASCTEPGSITYVGLLTGEVHETELAPLGHNFGEWTVTAAPSCTEAGEETRTCSRCDAVETRPVEALGHDYNAVVTEPTCTEGGFTTYTCTRCGDTYTDDETPALGHDFGDWTVTTAPTCLEDGEETRTCSRCDAVETRPVEALGHDYQAVVTEPTCTEAGFTT
ncbi:MAG: InlB B-repeat-containing protein, partial [Oscillospiraceae bacterium]|nr:InlB B-repeat-containing protein [Oscillospiraceae bacterium]